VSTGATGGGRGGGNACRNWTSYGRCALKGKSCPYDHPVKEGGNRSARRVGLPRGLGNGGAGGHRGDGWYGGSDHQRDAGGGGGGGMSGDRATYGLSVVCVVCLVLSICLSLSLSVSLVLSLSLSLRGLVKLGSVKPLSRLNLSGPDYMGQLVLLRRFSEDRGLV
jgi:hypothetical protein